MKKFEIFSIGRIVNNDEEKKLEIDEPFREAMDGLDPFPTQTCFSGFMKTTPRKAEAC